MTVCEKLECVNEYVQILENITLEEVKEIASSILLNDVENLTEELLDVMQVIKGIAYKFNIDLDANIEKHNKKLLSRGHKFI